MFETTNKTVPITKNMVKAAYKKVKANGGRSGVDKESLEEYQKDLQNNLYKLWNRLASGSYFPKPVLEVTIPKAKGGTRTLGIPTVSDRIAQQVIKSYLEPRLEAEFTDSSYGYRPLKSAHQAVEAVRENVRQYSWVLDMDIKSFFDEVDHELLNKALDKHVEEKWVKMYVNRWLKVGSQSQDGSQQTKDKGTPQGGVISPLLANLYLHYVLDKWLEKHYPNACYVRYADDIVVHCHSEERAKELLAAISQRLKQCSLRLNEQKTKIVYCQDYRRERKDYPKKFDFLGFSFKPRAIQSKYGVFTGYDCAISQASKKRIHERWRYDKIFRDTTVGIQQIAIHLNPMIRGIAQYYGKIERWSLRHLFTRLEFRLAKWVLNKYGRFKGSYRRAYAWLGTIRRSYPTMFYHWQLFKSF